MLLLFVVSFQAFTARRSIPEVKDESDEDSPNSAPVPLVGRIQAIATVSRYPF
jgi:hypothetical protein